jgi:polysaccharide export outer membrane protein
MGGMERAWRRAWAAVGRRLAVLVLALALVGVWPMPAKAVYLLAFGDGISLTVQGHPEYSVASVIRADGMVTVPVLGEVLASGLTTEALAQKVGGLLTRYVQQPMVFCVLTQPRPKVIFVVGQVRNPGRVELNRARPTVLDAIAGAGGFTPRAAQERVAVLRGDGYEVQRFEVNVQKMLRQADFSQNEEVMAGDRILVEEVWWPDVPAFLTAVAPVVSLVSLLILALGYYNSLVGLNEP